MVHMRAGKKMFLFYEALSGHMPSYVVDKLAHNHVAVTVLFVYTSDQFHFLKDSLLVQFKY